ncbi:hypothetical protein BH11PAT4_BH11PAT4_1280 [soil metagenome]
MRGVPLLLRRFLTGSLIILATLLPVLQPPRVAEAAGLELARDFINGLMPDAPNIYHEIYFVIPVSSEQLKPTDWILVEMPNYQLVSMAEAFFIGGFNTPTVSVVGTTVRITGLALLPGSGITIANLKATNPPAFASTEIRVKIAEDSNGTIVRNNATIIPTDSRSVVNTSATIEAPLSTLTISGYTGPSSFVTVTENGAVAGTTTSNVNGFFNFIISAADPGSHTYLIFSTDPGNRSTAQTPINVFLIASTLTTVSQVLLSSTLAIDKAQIDPGEAITFSGTAKPNSQINIFVEAPLRTYFSSTNASGEWSYSLSASDTQAYAPGQYQTYTIVQDTLGNQSITSTTRTFIVKSSGSSNPPPTCDISRGDLNCNGVTNLVDFSILLYHWGTDHRVADINQDGSVSLVDFSVMMFYFTN